MDLFIRLLRFILRYLLSLALILYSMTVGILTKKGRLFLKTLLNFYNVTFITKTIITQLPKISFDSVITNEIIEIIEPFGKNGNVNLDELAIINGIIKKEDPKKIFEIGTFDGRTTINMAYSSKDSCEIYTLDLPKELLGKTKFKVGDYDKTLIDKDIFGERIKQSHLKCKNKIKQISGDSATYNFESFYNSIDLVFIDGAHDYDNALTDSKTSLKLVGIRNGIILWHDYKNNVPVVNAIETIRQIHPKLNIYHIQGTNLAYCKVS